MLIQLNDRITNAIAFNCSFFILAVAYLLIVTQGKACIYARFYSLLCERLNSNTIFSDKQKYNKLLTAKLDNHKIFVCGF